MIKIMWIRIKEQRIKDSRIEEYKGRGLSTSNGMYCIEVKYCNSIKFFRFDTEYEYDRVLQRLDEVLKVQDV